MAWNQQNQQRLNAWGINPGKGPSVSQPQPQSSGRYVPPAPRVGGPSRGFGGGLPNNAGPQVAINSDPMAMPSASAPPSGSTMLGPVLGGGGGSGGMPSMAKGGPVRFAPGSYGDRAIKNFRPSTNIDVGEPTMLDRANDWIDQKGVAIGSLMRGNAPKPSDPKAPYNAEYDGMQNFDRNAGPAADYNLGDEDRSDAWDKADERLAQAVPDETDTGAVDPSIGDAVNKFNQGSNDPKSKVSDLFMHVYNKFGLGNAGDKVRGAFKEMDQDLNNTVDDTLKQAGMPQPTKQNDDGTDATEQQAIPTTDEDGTQNFAEGGLVEPNDEELPAGNNDDMSKEDEGSFLGRIGGAIKDKFSPYDPSGLDNENPEHGPLGRLKNAVGAAPKAGADDAPYSQRPGPQEPTPQQAVPTGDGQAPAPTQGARPDIQAEQPDPTNNPQQAQAQQTLALVSGRGAGDPAKFEQMKDAVDPNKLMTASQRNLLALTSTAEIYGDDAGGQMLQLMRGKFEAYRMDAIASMLGSQQKPADWARAVKSLNEMFPHLPDGVDVTFQMGQRGVFATINQNGETKNVQLTMPQALQLAKGAQFDKAFHEGFGKTLADALKSPEDKAKDEAAARTKANQAEVDNSEERLGMQTAANRRLFEQAHPFGGNKVSEFAEQQLGKDLQSQRDISKEGVKTQGKRDLQGDKDEAAGERNDARNAQKDRAVAASLAKADAHERNLMAIELKREAARLESDQLRAMANAWVAELKSPRALDGDQMYADFERMGLTKLFRLGDNATPTSPEKFAPAGTNKPKPMVEPPNVETGSDGKKFTRQMINGVEKRIPYNPPKQ